MSNFPNRTGFYGYTVQGFNGPEPDEHGRVSRAIISFVYENRVNDIEFTITNDPSHWGIQMADGSIISLRNPVVLFENRNGSIVEFNMDTPYPSNSPCTLVYRSSGARFTVHELDTTRPFTPNTLSPNFGFTVEGYGGSTDEYGHVKRALFSIPYSNRENEVEFTITNDPNHWGVQMGDGSLINLRDPVVLFANRDSSMVLFTLDESYPANSPAILVYRSAGASYSVREIDTPIPDIDVTAITNVPTSIIAKIPLNLSVAIVNPANATYQGIRWTIVNSGLTGASLNGRVLSTNAPGTLIIKGTILDRENNVVYDQDFTMTVVENVITIVSQPDPIIRETLNEISGRISINVRTINGEATYQWYHNTSNTNVGGTAILGATGASLPIPTELIKGSYYFFCEVKSPGAVTIRSSVCNVLVGTKLTGIQITPRITSISIPEEIQLSVNMIPSDADMRTIIWSTSNVLAVQITSSGKIKGVGEGTSIITAKTIGGEFLDSITVTIEEFVPVSNITNLITTIDTGVHTSLTGTIVPSNASKKIITWSVVNDGGTGAAIDVASIIASTTGIVVLRATIDHGASLTTDYTRDFVVNVIQRHIPVTNVTLNNLPSPIRAGIPITLDPTVTPANASNKVVNWAVKNTGTTGATISDGVLTTVSPGTVTLEARVINGASRTEDYTKDIVLTIDNPWVPVSHIEDLPPEMAIDDQLNLTGTIMPTNATMQAINFTLVDPGVTGATLTDNKLTVIMEGTVVIGVRIIDGIEPGRDFYTEHTVHVSDPFRPVTDVTLQLPSILRSWRPLLLTVGSDITPPNATLKDIRWRTDPTSGPESWMWTYPGGEVQESIQILPEYDYDIPGIYLYPYDPGTIILISTIVGAVVQGSTDFVKNWELTFLPPFIKVKDILDLITEIPVNDYITLTGVPFTDGGTGYANPSWDEGIPSYSHITWEIVDDGGTGATLSVDNIRCTSSGTVRLKATISQGVQEAHTWYDKTFEAIDYTKEFDILVIVPVTNITGVPNTVLVNTDLTLSATVQPTNATRKTIVWSISNPGVTNPTLTGNVLKCANAGTVTVRATITNGIGTPDNYIQEFNITVTAP